MAASGRTNGVNHTSAIPRKAHDVSSMFVRSSVSRSAGRAGIWDSRVRRNGVGGLSSMMRKL